MGGGSDLQRLSGGENVALGCITGVMAKACNYPFLVWKNAAQQGLPMVLFPLLVYRGLPMACLNLGGTNAVQFGATGVSTNEEITQEFKKSKNLINLQRNLTIYFFFESYVFMFFYYVY